MWSSDPLIPRRAVLPACLAAALLMLAGCGFQRTYAVGGNDRSPVRDAMAQIQVAPIPERVGQVVHNRLVDRLTPFGTPDRPAYWLEIHLSEDTQGLSLAHDETVTRYNYALSGRFRLSDAGTGRTLLTETAHAVAPFNVTRSEFATVVSSEDATENAAEMLANQIEARLAGYFGRALVSR